MVYHSIIVCFISLGLLDYEQVTIWLFMLWLLSRYNNDALIQYLTQKDYHCHEIREHIDFQRHCCQLASGSTFILIIAFSKLQIKDIHVSQMVFGVIWLSLTRYLAIAASKQWCIDIDPCLMAVMVKESLWSVLYHLCPQVLLDQYSSSNRLSSVCVFSGGLVLNTVQTIIRMKRHFVHKPQHVFDESLHVAAVPVTGR